MTEVPIAAKWRGRIGAPTIGLGAWVPLGDVAIPSALACRLTGADDAAGRWPDIELTFEVRDGIPQCVEMRTVSLPGDRPVRPDLLSAEDVARICERSFGLAAMSYDPVDGSMTAWEGPWDGSIVARAARVAVRRAGGGGAGTGPWAGRKAAELREVARVYLDPMSAPRRAQAVWSALYSDKTIATANRRIRDAREAGLIPAVGATDDELARAWATINLSRGPGPAISGERRRALLDAHLFGKKGGEK